MSDDHNLPNLPNALLFAEENATKKIILYFDIIISFTSKAITAGGAIDSALLFATCVVT